MVCNIPGTRRTGIVVRVSVECAPQVSLSSFDRINVHTIRQFVEIFTSDFRDSGPKARFAIARRSGIDSSRAAARADCRALLNEMLSRSFPDVDSDWELQRSASGAPRLLQNGMPSELSVSLSHSTDWIAAGISSQVKIGVDVEPIRVRERMSDIAGMFGWQSAVRDIGDFLSRWTFWEASAKCVGGSVLIKENPDFERLCKVGTNGSLSRTDRWAGLIDCVDHDAYYAVALHGHLKSDLLCRKLDSGSIQAW